MVKRCQVFHLKMSYCLMILGFWFFCMAENVCFIHSCNITSHTRVNVLPFVDTKIVRSLGQ